MPYARQVLCWTQSRACHTRGCSPPTAGSPDAWRVIWEPWSRLALCWATRGCWGPRASWAACNHSLRGNRMPRHGCSQAAPAGRAAQSPLRGEPRSHRLMLWVHARQVKHRRSPALAWHALDPSPGRAWQCQRAARRVPCPSGRSPAAPGAIDTLAYQLVGGWHRLRPSPGALGSKARSNSSQRGRHFGMLCATRSLPTAFSRRIRPAVAFGIFWAWRGFLGDSRAPRYAS